MRTSASSSTVSAMPLRGQLGFFTIWLLGLGGLFAMVLGFFPASALAIFGILLALLISIAVGVMNQRCGFFARPWNGRSDLRDICSLTFDDGPDPDFTPLVLDLLSQHHQRATFFVIGEKAKKYPALTARIGQAGHEIGVHSMRHPWHMALWPSRKIADDLTQCAAVIAEQCGAVPTFFRPVAAVLSPNIARGAQRAGLRLVGYSVRSGDGSRHLSSRWVQRRLLTGLKAGAVLLLHDSRVDDRAPASLPILNTVLDEMARRGLQSVTLKELEVAPSQTDRPNE